MSKKDFEGRIDAIFPREGCLDLDIMYKKDETKKIIPLKLEKSKINPKIRLGEELVRGVYIKGTYTSGFKRGKVEDIIIYSH